MTEAGPATAPSVFARLVDGIHHRLFKTSPSAEMRLFLVNLSHFSYGTLIGGALLFTFNVLSGRLLGTEQYGFYQLALSYGGLLLVPILFGLNVAFIRYLTPVRADLQRARSLFGTTTLLISAFLLILCGAALLLKPILLPVIKIPAPLFYLSIGFAAVQALWAPLKSSIFALQRYRLAGHLEALFQLLVFSIFLLLFWRFPPRGELGMITQIIATPLILLVAALFLRRLLTIQWSTVDAKRLLTYGSFVTLGALATTLLASADRFLLNYYFNSTLVGIAQSYVQASTFVTSTLIQLLANTLFPTLCKFTDNRAVLQKLHRIAWFSSIGIFAINLVMIPIILHLYGNEFPKELSLIVLYALNSTFFWVYQIYFIFINTEGKKGTRFTTLMTVGASMGFILLNILLIPSLGLIGAPIASILMNLGLTGILASTAKRFSIATP